MIATTSGRHPVRAIWRISVVRPTPAKVSRNAHFDTLARLAVWPLESQCAVAIAETARNPSTNLGNFAQMNATFAFAPGAISSASPRADQYSAKARTTNPISALRVDFTSTAILPAASEYR